MRKIFFACTLLLSFSVLVGCGKDNDDEPGSGNGNSGSSNVSSGNVNLGKDSFKAKYAYVVYGSNFDSEYDEYIFADKDILKYVDMGEDIDDVDEEFSTVYIDYNSRLSYVDDLYIDYKYNGYRGTGFSFEYEEDEDIDEYVSLSISKKNVKVSTKSLPMVRYNERTGNETECKVSFSLEGSPLDVSDYADYDDDYYDYTRASIEVKEISEPKQVEFLKSFKHKRGN